MTSTTTRIITIAFAVLAIAAPIASAAPLRDGSPQLRTGSLAGTTETPARDWRNPDNRAPIYVPPATQQDKPKIANVYVPPAPQQDKPKIANVYVPPTPQQPQTMAPATAHKQQQPAVADDDGTSPFLYIVPGVALIALLGTGVALMRPSRRPAHA